MPLACRLFGQAAKQGPSESMRADAAIAAGNASCASADLMDGQHLKHALLQQACESYRFALKIDEDAMTHSNLGDALVGGPLPPSSSSPRHTHVCVLSICGHNNAHACAHSAA